MCNYKACYVDGGCPFSGSDQSEVIQNYGCLPSPYEIINMAKNHGRKWACHSDISKPCKGAIQYIKENKISVTYIDDAPLVNDRDNWKLYVD